MSESVRIPITPAIIPWARKRFNMDTEYVAKTIGINTDKLQAYENGTEDPTYTQLEAMAKLFRVPLEVFFYPEIPNLDKPDIKHRALYSEYLLDTPTEILLVMNKAEVMQNNLRELCNGQNPAISTIKENLEDKPIDIAAKIREILGVKIEEQPHFSDYAKAFNFWREKLADHGVFIFRENFKNDGYYGFCLDDPEFPVIYLNSSVLPQRQIFTIFHELYHLIKNRSGIDIPDDESHKTHLSSYARELERDCDEFAGEFLVPTENLKATIKNNDKYSRVLKSGSTAEIQNYCIQSLAKKYAVSYQTILVRLIQIGVLKESDYEKLNISNNKKNKSSDDDSTSGGPTYYIKTISQLGRPYIELVYEKQREFGFEDYQVAEYLGIKTKNLEGLNEKLWGVHARI